MITHVLEPTAKTRVLILGSGFGGLYAALHLDKTIAAEPNVEVTLVSRENFVLFTPMLHEGAAGDLDDRHRQPAPQTRQLHRGGRGSD